MQEIFKKQQANYTLSKLQEIFSNIEELGCGTFSTVYQATHILTNLPVCLKVFEPSLPQKARFNSNGNNVLFDESLELIENEISILKKLDHPFITKYYGIIFIPSNQSEKSAINTPALNAFQQINRNDTNRQKNAHIQIENTIKHLSNEVNFCGMKPHLNIRVNKPSNTENNVSEKGTYIIVMELVKGVTLLDFINQFGKIDEQEACRIFAQIVDAFYYLQDDHVNVVHRDVKLENIMLDENYNVRIIDFGFSKSLNDQKELLKTQCGSYPYSAPELLQNSPYTKAVDVWSLGILLYAMVNGSLPFEDTNMTKLSNKILYSNPKYSEDISQPCIDLISKMLEKNPSKRTNLKEVKEHEWMKEHSNIVYNEEFTKKFQNKRNMATSMEKCPKFSQSNNPLVPDQVNFETNNSELKSKSNSAGNIIMLSDSDSEIEKLNSSFPTYIYDSLLLHEISKVLQKTIQQIIDELNLFDRYEIQYNIHQLIQLSQNNQEIKTAFQTTKMVNRILENKNKSKKLSFLISLRMNNAQAQVLSNQEIKTKLPMLSLSPIKNKETQDVAFRLKKLSKQSNVVNLMPNGQQQAIRLMPKKKTFMFGKMKYFK